MKLAIRILMLLSQPFSTVKSPPHTLVNFILVTLMAQGCLRNSNKTQKAIKNLNLLEPLKAAF